MFVVVLGALIVTVKNYYTVKAAPITHDLYEMEKVVTEYRSNIVSADSTNANIIQTKYKNNR